MDIYDKENDVELPIKIENNILKGEVVPFKSSYTSVGKLLFDTFKKDPNCVTQVDSITETEDTFQDILDRSIKCALWLQKQGVKSGDIVAVSSHNHPDSYIPCIATLFIGAIYNPWDYEMNIHSARYFMTLTHPKVFFANEQSIPVIMEAAKLEAHHVKLVTFGNHPGTTPFANVLKGHDESLMTNFQCNEISDPEQVAIILFSSGTTGLPKGVQLPHRSFLSFLELNKNISFKGRLMLWFSPLDWLSGPLFSFMCIILHGKRLVAPTFDEETTCKLIEKFKVWWMMLSTSSANRFVRYDRLRDYDLSSLKYFLIGGSSMGKAAQDLMKERFPWATVSQGYGMTELCNVGAAQTADSTSGSCGTVVSNTEIKIIDPETGKTLGPHQNGEICVRAPSLMSGYYKNPVATKNAIDKEGWLHTGDMGYYNEKGELFVIDRLKELIKFQGHHVVPAELEKLLQTHPAVLEAGVVGIPHPIDGEHPIAFVSKIPSKKVSEEELMKLVANNLVDYCKLRGGVKFLPSLPHTASGKISRKELKAMAKALVVP